MSYNLYVDGRGLAIVNSIDINDINEATFFTKDSIIVNKKLLINLSNFTKEELLKLYYLNINTPNFKKKLGEFLDGSV